MNQSKIPKRSDWMRTIWFYIGFTTLVFLIVESTFLKSPGQFIHFNNKVYGKDLNSATYVYGANVDVKDDFLAAAIQFKNLTNNKYTNFSAIVEVLNDNDYVSANIVRGLVLSNRVAPFLVLHLNQISATDIHISFILDHPPPTNSFINIIAIIKNNCYASRRILYRTAFFVSSIVYMFYFVRIKTSSYRKVSGALMIIYAIISNEPFTVTLFSAKAVLLRNIARLCQSAIVMHFAFVVKGKTSLPLILFSISVCLIYFIIQALNVFEIMKQTSNYIFSLESWNLKTKLSIVIILCYTTIALLHRAFNDLDIRNYILLFIVLIGCISQVIDITQNDTLIFQIISMGALQLFTMQFPQQMKQRIKEVIIDQSLTTVPTEKELVDSISESTEYESNYSDDYNDDDDYCSDCSDISYSE